ncbi:hypothetical protein GCM10009719_37660 [Nocardioides kribbensis]
MDGLGAETVGVEGAHDLPEDVARAGHGASLPVGVSAGAGRRPRDDDRRTPDRGREPGPAKDADVPPVRARHGKDVRH